MTEWHYGSRGGTGQHRKNRDRLLRTVLGFRTPPRGALVRTGVSRRVDRRESDRPQPEVAVKPPRPRTRHVVIAAMVFFAAYVIWLVGGWSQQKSMYVADDLILVAASLPPMIFSALAVRSTQGRLRAAWSTLAVGLLSWNIGEWLWTYAEITKRKNPGPSLADVFYLLWPVAAVAALLLFWNRRPQQSYVRIVLDGFIVAGSFFLIAWVLIINDTYQAGATKRLELILYMAYPINDVIIATVAAIVLAHSYSRQRVVLSLLTLGMMIMAVNDLVYSYISSQVGVTSAHVLDICWIAGLLMLTVAAALGREVPQNTNAPIAKQGWASVLLPYTPLLLAAAVLAYQPPEVDAAPVVKIVGAMLFVVVLIRQFLSVRENRQLLSLVSEQARFDPLTGLANRVVFDEGLNRAMQRHRRADTAVGLILIDLNDFKFVNDTLGHLAGDEVLQIAGERILHCIREGDTVARLGGDEFAVLIEGTPDEAGRVAQRIVDCFSDPFLIDGNDLSIKGSVGLALLRTNEPAISAEELFKRADVAMYAVKRSSLGGVQLFNPEMKLDHKLSVTRGGAASEAELLPALRLGIERSEFTLVYQPKIDLRTTDVVGVEALLRWVHPDRGVLVPEEFLSLVRRHGLMKVFTDFVVSRALDDISRLRSSSISLHVAVNLFAPLVADRDLSTKLTGELRDRGLAADCLTVEITEDLLLANLEQTQDVLNRLRQSGIRISVDDFGTGNSGLAYLRDLPVDEVKLDREFIAPIRRNPRAAAVAGGIIDLGHDLGLTTVAEGVEDAETATMLTELGCDVAQGYLFSPPLTIEELTNSLTQSPINGAVRLKTAAPTSM